jgi:MFS transporter, FHS family, glucose/mannose:H+ symporter
MSISGGDKSETPDSAHGLPAATSSSSAPRGHNFNSTSLLIAANACMFVFGAVLLLMGSLLPSLQVSYAQAGNLGSFPLAGILVATVLVGPILDLTGAKPVLAVALGLITSSLALMPALDSYSALAIAAFTYGLGGGLLNTAANALVADLSAAGRAAALNLLGFFFSLGAISAPMALSSLGGNLSAAAVLRSLAILCLLIFALVLALRFPPAAKAGVRLWNLLAVLRHSAIWMLSALLFFESGSENCMFVWAGKIVADTLHAPPRQANMALVALSAALGAGRLLAVLWLRCIGNRRTIWLSTTVVIAGSLVVMNANHFPGMVTGMLLIGLGLSAIFPTALGVASDLFPAETGTVFGAIIAVALVGGTAGPKLAGWAASYGLRHVLLIPVFAAVAVAALTAAVAPRGSQPLRAA